jgi:DNA repair protein RadD
MELLRETLVRMGSHELSLMLGSDTVTLLELLDLDSIRTSNLADFIINQIGVEDILLDKERRHAVIESLSKLDADRLVRLLQLPEDENSWSLLTNQNFIRGSHPTDVLFSFFGCPLGSDDEALPDIPDRVTIRPSYSLFDHQIKACREAIGFLYDESRPRVMLHMPTGAGKTRTAMNVIAHFLRELFNKDQVVLWLAHSEELCEQATNEFENAWSILGNRDLPLHRCYGDHPANFDDFQAGMVIGGLQLLYRRSINDQSAFLRFAQRVPLVVMDEAHQAIAPSYKHLLNILAADPATAILGLSATPGRQTVDAHEDVQLAEFFKRQKVTLDIEGYSTPIDYLQQEGYLAKVNYESLPFHPNRDFSISSEEIEKLQQGLDLPESVIQRLGEDHTRNLLIINHLIEAAQQGCKILVFACSVHHAHLIANLLVSKGYRAAAITGKTRADRRRHLVTSFRDGDEIQILTNYGVLSTGFDAPKTNLAMITRPTQSVVLYSQMVGRAARGVLAGGNAECRILTIVDQLPGFRNITEAFKYWDDIWE